MKHLLIDFDSTIPNLALMKIASWAKQKGDEVFLNDDSIEPDFVWLSCIIDDYLRNLDQIKEDGLLTKRLAIGSICRRGQTKQIARIIRTVKRELPSWVKLHAFGVKSNVLSTDAKYLLHSADSQSWGIQERYYSWGKNSNKGLTWHEKVPGLLSYVEKMEAILIPEPATLLPYIQIEKQEVLR